MAEDLFWVWRDDGGYLINKDRKYTGEPCLSAATYETLANFFLQEERNAARDASLRSEEGYKPRVATDVTGGAPSPSGDLEQELLNRVWRQNRIEPLSEMRYVPLDKLDDPNI